MSTFDITDMQWTPKAKAMLKKIPFFVRSQARQRVEELAYENQTGVVTAALVEQARVEFGQ